MSFHRKDFLAILESDAYYKDRVIQSLFYLICSKEAFCCIRDKVNLYKDYSPFFKKCYICNEQNHFIHDCPHGHYIPDPYYIIELVNEKNRAFMQSFVRRIRPKFNALGHKQEVMQHVNKYKVNILDLSFDEKVMEDSPLKFRLSDVEEEEDSVMGISEFENFSDNITATKNQILKLQARHSSQQKKLKSRKIASILNTLKKNLFEDVDEELVFDRVKSFSKYFVHNNVENVISKINQLNEIKRSEKLNDMRRRKSLANIQTARSPTSLLKNIQSFPKLLSLRRRSIQEDFHN